MQAEIYIMLSLKKLSGKGRSDSFGTEYVFPGPKYGQLIQQGLSHV